MLPLDGTNAPSFADICISFYCHVTMAPKRKAGSSCRRCTLSLFRTSRFQVESFITDRRTRRHQHQTDIFQATDAVYPDRMLSIPTGCRTSEAFRQVYIVMQFFMSR
jgi:hypothetical protein